MTLTACTLIFGDDIPRQNRQETVGERHVNGSVNIVNPLIDCLLLINAVGKRQKSVNLKRVQKQSDAKEDQESCFGKLDGLGAHYFH